MEERQRVPENCDWESDTPFRLRISFMPNAQEKCITGAKAHRIHRSRNLLIYVY